MKLYNTLTRQIEPFEPRDPSRVTIYVCGPTVYDDPHIGHARSAYIFDVLRRHLAHVYKNAEILFVRNVTDVDDKIIEKARQEFGTSGDLAAKCREVAERYLKSYKDTMGRLGIDEPTKEPKATEHIDAMLDLISKLVLDNVAYEAKGDVYFSVRKFAAYGKLSNRTLDALKAGARVEPGEHKEDPLDFALWKAAKPGEPSWKSPWGKGRPGWHIECSAMSTKYLGDTFDLHGGGVDLVFPHHENEIAQAQAVGKPFAKRWVHNGLLTVNGEKMSKSLGNFVTVENALEACRGYSDALKVFFLSAHYRSPIDCAPQLINAAYIQWYKLRAPFDYVESGHNSHETLPQESARQIGQIREQIKRAKDAFEQALDNDLNTPQALACLEQLVDLANGCVQGTLLPDTAVGVGGMAAFKLGLVETTDALRRLGSTLGLFQHEGPPPLSQEQRRKIAEREEARRQGDFKRADQIRRQLSEEQIDIEDTSRGPHPRRRC